MGNGLVRHSLVVGDTPSERQITDELQPVASNNLSLSHHDKKQLTRSLGVPCHRNYIYADFRFVRPIGSGRLTKIFLAQSMKIAQNAGFPRYAIKEVPASQMNRQQLSEFRYELNLLSHLQHPNLPRLCSVYDTHGNELQVGNGGNNRSIVYVVMEHLNGGELLPALCRQRQYMESDVVRLVRQLTSAVGYLHSQGVAHGCLLPENLILTQAGSLESALRIVDFGRAESEHHYHPSVAVSNDMSHLQELRVPEILHQYTSMSGHSLQHHSGISFSVREKMAMDVWCVGVLAHLLLSGLLPGEEGGTAFAPRIHSKRETNLMASSPHRIFSSPSSNEALPNPNLLPSLKYSDKTEELNASLQPRFQAHQWMFVTDEAKDFVYECLRISPSNRPSLSDMLQHSWFQMLLESDEQAGSNALKSAHSNIWPETCMKTENHILCPDDCARSNCSSNSEPEVDIKSEEYVRFGTVRVPRSVYADNNNSQYEHSEGEDDENESISLTAECMLHNDLTRAVLPHLKRYVEQRCQEKTAVLYAQYQRHYMASMRNRSSVPSFTPNSSLISSSVSPNIPSSSAAPPASLIWTQPSRRYLTLSAQELFQTD